MKKMGQQRRCQTSAMKSIQLEFDEVVEAREDQVESLLSQ
jgi:hypothetical protein